MMKKFAKQLRQFEELSKCQPRKLDEMHKENAELKRHASTKSRGGDLGRTMNFANAVEYMSNIVKTLISFLIDL